MAFLAVLACTPLPARPCYIFGHIETTRSTVYSLKQIQLYLFNIKQPSLVVILLVKANQVTIGLRVKKIFIKNM